jgi:hypothetical protein
VFSVSLILAPAKSGGDFEFAPRSKQVVDSWTEFTPELLEYARPSLQAGDLYIFQGQDSLHRVTPVQKGTRVNAIFTYNEQPGCELNEYTQLKFFGRRFSPSGARNQ